MGDFKVVDISDPTNPSVVGHVEVPEGWATDVEIVGDAVYEALGIGYGIRIIDISDPTTPILGNLVEHDASSVTVSGEFVYVGGYSMCILHITSALPAP